MYSTIYGMVLRPRQKNIDSLSSLLFSESGGLIRINLTHIHYYWLLLGTKVKMFAKMTLVIISI